MKNLDTLWLNRALIILMFFCFIFLFYMVYNVIFDQNKKKASFSKKNIQNKNKDDPSIFLPNNIPNKNIETPIIVEKNVVIKGQTRFEYVELNNGKIIIFSMTETYEPCPNDVRLSNEIDYASEQEAINQKEILSSLVAANDFELVVKTDEEKEIDKAVDTIDVVDAVVLTSDDYNVINQEQINLFANHTFDDLVDDDTDQEDFNPHI